MEFIPTHVKPPVAAVAVVPFSNISLYSVTPTHYRHSKGLQKDPAGRKMENISNTAMDKTLSGFVCIGNIHPHRVRCATLGFVVSTHSG